MVSNLKYCHFRFRFSLIDDPIPLPDKQAGFRRQEYDPANTGIEINSREGEKERSNNVNCFMDFQKALDSIRNKATWAVLQSYRVGTRLIDLLKNTNENATVNEGNGLMWEKGPDKETWFLPYMFITHLERLWMQTKIWRWHRNPLSQHQQSEIYRWHRPNRGKQQQFTGSSTTLKRARKAIGSSRKQSKDIDNGIWKR